MRAVSDQYSTKHCLTSSYHPGLTECFHSVVHVRKAISEFVLLETSVCSVNPAKVGLGTFSICQTLCDKTLRRRRLLARAKQPWPVMESDMAVSVVNSGKKSMTCNKFGLVLCVL